MPKGPRGEKRPADTNACAVKVAKIATGEAQDERYLVPGRVRSGKAGAKARVEKVSSEERHKIASEAALSRWTRDTAMSQRELLIERLFGDEQHRHVDIKFLRGPREVTEEEFCREVNSALLQVRTGQAPSNESFDEEINPVLWREIIKQL